MMRLKRQGRSRPDIAGFTLIEALISTVLMASILSALAVITAQWMPNWNHGFARVQQSELASRGLERIVADLSAAEFIPPTGNANANANGPLFYGEALSVTFVRSAVGPNTRPGLEFVQMGETADARGLAVVRTRAPYFPIPATGLAQLRFIDPVVLLRAPYRVSFAYAGADRVWQQSWRGAQKLPAAVRVTVRDAATSQLLAVSTATIVHVDAPASCATANNQTNSQGGNPGNNPANNPGNNPANNPANIPGNNPASFQSNNQTNNQTQCDTEKTAAAGPSNAGH
jgi:general secretion pathway protein J